MCSSISTHISVDYYSLACSSDTLKYSTLVNVLSYFPPLVTDLFGDRKTIGSLYVVATVLVIYMHFGNKCCQVFIMQIVLPYNFIIIFVNSIDALLYQYYNY